MSPLLPGYASAGEPRALRRGAVYWADPHFPTGASSKPHRCLLLRSPAARETNVPVLTLHTLARKPDAVNDCCTVLEPGAYRGIKAETVIDARMTMFVPVLMVRDYCFDLSEEDMAEIEDCLLVALDFGND